MVAAAPSVAPLAARNKLASSPRRFADVPRPRAIRRVTDSPDHELVSCDAAVSTAATDVQAALRIREQDGVDRLIPALYDELRRMARLHLRRTRRADAADPTLATTALVNEAYLRLVGHSTSHWNDRAHFLALAAVAMRHILVDGARARGRLKRGAGHTADTLQSGAAA